MTDIMMGRKPYRWNSPIRAYFGVEDDDDDNDDIFAFQTS
jgi:hypothetical protein